MPFVNAEIGGLDKMGDYASITGLVNLYNKKLIGRSRFSMEMRFARST